MKKIDKKELDKLIICKKCHTLHRKIELHHGTKAECKLCNTVIYRHHTNIIESSLAFSLVALISLFIAFSFSILTININGIYKSLDLFSLLEVIFQNNYYIVGMMLSFLIFIFPLAILLSMILLLILMKLKKSKYLVKRLLILIAKLLPWSMVDIFFISILVSMVKLFAYAQLELGVAFGAFIITLFLDILILKRISFNDLWTRYEYIYRISNVQR